jgi:hypothetical protein
MADKTDKKEDRVEEIRVLEVRRTIRSVQEDVKSEKQETLTTTLVQRESTAKAQG